MKLKEGITVSVRTESGTQYFKRGQEAALMSAASPDVLKNLQESGKLVDEAKVAQELKAAAVKAEAEGKKVAAAQEAIDKKVADAKQ